MSTLDTTIISQYYAGILRLNPATATAVINNYATFPTYASVMESMETSAISSVDPVIRLYQAAFGRVPDTGGLDYWVQQYTGGGAGGTRSLETMAAGFAASQEFVAKYGAMSNSQYIGALYVNILNREADKGGLDWWVDQLNTGKMNRSQVLNAFAQSPEFYDLAYNHIKAFETECALGTETYTGSLFDQGVDPTQYLTVNRDDIQVTGAVENTVYGVIGTTYTESTNVGTFTLGDNIHGNTLTTVDLLVANPYGYKAPYVTMSGVDALAFNDVGEDYYSGEDVWLDGSSYGKDISHVSARGTGGDYIGVTGLDTNGTFTVTTASDFAGSLAVGYGEDGYAISTTLFANTAAEGVDATVYERGGSNSVVMTDVVGGDDNLTVVAGDGKGYYDEADVSLYHVVHESTDLVIAPEIRVGTIQDTVKKNASSTVEVENNAIKTTYGSARSDSITIGAVNAAVADSGFFALDVVSAAEVENNNGDTSAYGTATAKNITVTGAISTTGEEYAETNINIVNTAHPEALSAGEAGNISIGSISELGSHAANGVRSGDATVDITNEVDEADGGGTAAGTATLKVGNLTIAGATTITGWDDADVELQNVVNTSSYHGDTDGALYTDDVTVGNLSAGAVTLSGRVATFDTTNGVPNAADGSVTVGNTTLGSISVTGVTTTGSLNTALNPEYYPWESQRVSPHVAIANIAQVGVSYDESATVGTLTIGTVAAPGSITATATSGAAQVLMTNQAAVSTNVDAVANNASAGALTAGNITATTGNAVNANITNYVWVPDTGTGGEYVPGTTANNAVPNFNAVANISISELAETAGTVGDTATVGNVSLGNLSAQAGNSYNTTHGALALVDVNVEASTAASGTAATVGTVSMGNLSAVVGNGTTLAYIDDAAAAVTVNVDSLNANTTTIGAVTIGNITANAGSKADSVAVVDIGDSHVDSLGNVTIGAFTMAAGNQSATTSGTDVDLLQSVTVDAVTVNSVAVGASTLTAGTGTQTDAAINIRATGVAGGAAGNIGTVTVGDHTVTAGTVGRASAPAASDTTNVAVEVTVDSHEGNINTVTLGSFTQTVGAAGTLTPTMTATQTASLDIRVHTDGNLADFVSHNIGTVTVGNVALNLPSIQRQKDASTLLPVWQEAHMSLQVTDADLGSIGSVAIGNVAIAGGYGVHAVGEDNGILVDSMDNITSVTVASSSIVLGNEADMGSLGDIGIYADNLITGVTIGNVTRTVGTYQETTTPDNVSNIEIIGARVGNVGIGNVTVTGGVDAHNVVNIDVETTGAATAGLLGALTVGNLTATSSMHDAYAAGLEGSKISVTYDNTSGTTIAQGVTIGNVAMTTATGANVSTGSIDSATDVSILDLAHNFSHNGNALTVGNVALNYAGSVENHFIAVASAAGTMDGSNVTIGNVAVTGVNASTPSTAFNGFTLAVSDVVASDSATGATSVDINIGNISVSGTTTATASEFATLDGGSDSWFTLTDDTDSASQVTIGNVDYSNFSAISGTVESLTTINVSGSGAAGSPAWLGAATIDGATTNTTIYDNATTQTFNLHDANGGNKIVFSTLNDNSTLANHEIVNGWKQTATGITQDKADITTEGGSINVVTGSAGYIFANFDELRAAAVADVTANTTDVFVGSVDGTFNSYAFYLNDALTPAVTAIEFVGVQTLTSADFA